MVSVRNHQLNIYNELSYEDDPIYRHIANLASNQQLQLENFIISLNHSGLYEIEGKELHDCASDMMEFYKKVINVLNTEAELNFITEEDEDNLY